MTGQTVQQEKKQEDKTHQHHHEEKTEMKEKPIEQKPTGHQQEHKKENVQEEKKEEKSAQIQNQEIKKEEKKQTKKIQKKEEAIARGRSIPVSKRQCMYISQFIKNKSIDKAITDLEEVIKFKRAVPFKGEIPHRKGKLMMSGRYPIKASKYFIKILKGLRGNALINGMDLEKTKIISGSANWASRPMRKEGRKAKRTHVLIKAMEAEQE